MHAVTRRITNYIAQVISVFLEPFQTVIAGDWIDDYAVARLVSAMRQDCFVRNVSQAKRPNNFPFLRGTLWLIEFSDNALPACVVVEEEEKHPRFARHTGIDFIRIW